MTLLMTLLGAVFGLAAMTSFMALRGVDLATWRPDLGGSAVRQSQVGKVRLLAEMLRANMGLMPSTWPSPW